MSMDRKEPFKLKLKLPNEEIVIYTTEKYENLDSLIVRLQEVSNAMKHPGFTVKESKINGDDN